MDTNSNSGEVLENLLLTDEEKIFCININQLLENDISRTECYIDDFTSEELEEDRLSDLIDTLEEKGVLSYDYMMTCFYPGKRFPEFFPKQKRKSIY